MPSCTTATGPAGPEPAPRTDRTLEINLTAVRDLARYLAASRPSVTGWQLTAASDVEAFLATIASPASRARQLHALRVFFRWARSHHLILADPARGLRPTSNIPFPGRLLSAAEQRQLLHRWTADGGNPHLLVSQKSKTTAEPVSASYLKRLLTPAGVTPTLLRVTRLAHLVTTLDPVIVAGAFSVRRGTVPHYLADTVDPSRLANP
jgi:hypothetical protein